MSIGTLHALSTVAISNDLSDFKVAILFNVKKRTRQSYSYNGE